MQVSTLVKLHMRVIHDREALLIGCST